MHCDEHKVGKNLEKLGKTAGDALGHFGDNKIVLLLGRTLAHTKHFFSTFNNFSKTKQETTDYLWRIDGSSFG